MGFAKPYLHAAAMDGADSYPSGIVQLKFDVAYLPLAFILGQEKDLIPFIFLRTEEGQMS